MTIFDYLNRNPTMAGLGLFGVFFVTLAFMGLVAEMYRLRIVDKAQDKDK